MAKSNNNEESKGKVKEKVDWEEFFWDFWPTVDKEVKKERLEQELLTLTKREWYRQYVALAAMMPFTLLMATELASVYSESVLLGTISAGLSHALLPFAILSLICTLYLIYNNRKIAQKNEN